MRIWQAKISRQLLKTIPLSTHKKKVQVMFGNLVSNMEVYINALMDIEKAKNVNDDIKTEEERKLEELWNDIQRLKS